MTAREVLDELEQWGRSGWTLSGADGAEVHAVWLKRLRHLRETVEDEAQAVLGAPSRDMAGGLRAMDGAHIAAEPTALEVALRLIESGKCPAIPTQARAMAFGLIDAVRAEETRRAKA